MSEKYISPFTITNKIVEDISAISKQIGVIDAIDRNPRITIRELAETLQLSLKQARTTLDALKKNGILEHIGSTKSGSWKILVPLTEYRGKETA